MTNCGFNEIDVLSCSIKFSNRLDSIGYSKKDFANLMGFAKETVYRNIVPNKDVPVVYRYALLGLEYKLDCEKIKITYW